MRFLVPFMHVNATETVVILCFKLLHKSKELPNTRIYHLVTLNSFEGIQSREQRQGSEMVEEIKPYNTQSR